MIAPDWTVSVWQPDDAAAWAEALARSANGTLFHDPRFLAYHPPGRHDFRHLLLRQGGKIAAMLPGGVCHDDDGATYVSPLGASFGGPAFVAKPNLARAVGAVTALRDFIVASGWRGIQITLPPALYQGSASGLISFALAHAGFRLHDRQLCFVLPVASGDLGGFVHLFRSKSAGLVRAAARAGAQVMRGGRELLPQFLPLLHDTYHRHGVAPTHSDDDLRAVLSLCPDRIRLHVTMQDGETTGGICVFRISPQVDAVFYICTRADRSRDNGALVAIADAIDAAAQGGCRWLDLGPSADHARINQGVAAFKEHLGAEYHLREGWRITP